MYAPTTAWDRNPTDAELIGFYGRNKSSDVQDNIIEVLTETVRTVPAMNLSLPYVSYRNDAHGKVEQYPLTEILVDYGTDSKPLQALLAVFEKSDCPLVAAFRLALAERFADANAEELEEFKRDADECRAVRDEESWGE